jgi:Galactose oxidase, central domain
MLRRTIKTVYLRHDAQRSLGARVIAPLLFLASAVLIGGCGHRFTRVEPENFSMTGPVTYLDKDGKPISAQALSYELAQAPTIEVAGQRYPTPAGVNASLIAGLAPIAPDSTHPTRIRVPVNGRSTLVTGWTGIRLSNQKIFVVGGCGANSANALDSTWLFDPSTARVSEDCQLHVARTGAQLTLLSDGRVFISGGCPSKNASPPLAWWELYDPVNDSISMFGPMCRPRDDQGAAQLNNGNVLMVGGHTTPRYTQADSDLTATAEIFEPSTGKSRIVGKLIMPSTNAIVIPSGNDQAIVIGGFHQNTQGDFRWIHGAEKFEGSKK